MLLKRLPPESSTVRAVHGDAVLWGHEEHLLALIADLLAAANWQRGGDKNKPRPKPIERPGSHNGRRRLAVSGTEMQRRLLEQRARLQKG